jgi:hypothetical protein
MDRALAAFMVLLSAFSSSYAASPTSTLLKSRASYTAAVTTGKWQSNFYKAKKYAVDNGLPFIAVWSNGDQCGHCIMFENGCNTSYFKNWMASSGMVFYFTYYGDKGNGTTTKSGSKADDGSEGSKIFHWIRANKNTGYPFVRIYWPKGKVDIATVGDTVDGNKDNTAGAKKSVAYFKSKLKNFSPAPAVVKPYYVDFEPNGGTGEMARVTAKVGTAFTLPANAFVRPDCSFLGWAKTASGSVAYKNKASVKNLTTVSNDVVTLYAKWRRVTYRTYYTGVNHTISMSDLKGWTPNKAVTGMKWNKSKGKWTGKPSKAGTFTITFKKNKSSTTRKVVVVKDAVTFADETALNRAYAAGETVSLDLSPASKAGEARSVTVTGLPPGLGYADGAVTGVVERVGTFNANVSVVSANGQKLSRTLTIQAEVPEFCIGTFNGFIGFADTNRLDELALSNRGTFRLAAPSNASLSAKVVTAKGSYAFTGQGWYKEGSDLYVADLATKDGKHALQIRASDEATGLKASFHEVGTFTPSYGTAYSVWAQRAPFARNADGSYCDPVIDAVMGRVVGKWYFKAYGAGSTWLLDYTTAKNAGLVLSVAADGTAKLAGKVGSYSVSASSAVFVFDGDVDAGFVRADFPVTVTVKNVKKTLDIWLNLWFDRDHSHYNARGEGIGAATVETFK